jgi:hypothetical protein
MVKVHPHNDAMKHSFSRPNCKLCPATAGGLPGRCLFSNHCLCIRLLGLPCGCDVAECFAGCAGLLLVSHGQLEIETTDGHRVLREGDSLPLPSAEALHLWASSEFTDVVFIEQRESGPKGQRSVVAQSADKKWQATGSGPAAGLAECGHAN